MITSISVVVVSGFGMSNWIKTFYIPLNALTAYIWDIRPTYPYQKNIYRLDRRSCDNNQIANIKSLLSIHKEYTRQSRLSLAQQEHNKTSAAALYQRKALDTTPFLVSPLVVFSHSIINNTTRASIRPPIVLPPPFGAPSGFSQNIRPPEFRRPYVLKVISLYNRI